MFSSRISRGALEIIAREGADAFYRGKLARLTADFYEKNGGLLRYDDLASYQPEEGSPIRTATRDMTSINLRQILRASFCFRR